MMVLNSALAIAESYADNYRESVFHIGTSASQYAFTGKDGFKVIGNSGVINIGGGFIAQNYFSLSSLDIILGPYQPLHDSESRLDYSGTGFSTNIGWSWNSDGMRRAGGSFGILAGFRYLDIVGRSVGTRTLDTGTITDQVNQIYDFSLMPAFFYARLKNPRPKGNDPELLTTRLEGLIITIGVAFPMKADFTQEYIETLNENQSSAKVKSKGELEGRTYVLNIIAPLGV